jgi:hypothetical protein
MKTDQLAMATTMVMARDSNAHAETNGPTTGIGKRMK